MANPQIIACPKDVWTKVASGVTGGQIYARNNLADYFITYRTAGFTPAPPNGDVSEGVLMNKTGVGTILSFAAAVDVYVACTREAGEVRADL